MQNVGGMRTKANDFYTSVLSNSYDLIIITESWLSDDQFDSEFFDMRYKVFRQDRNFELLGKAIGGGVMLGCLQKHNMYYVNSIDSYFECIITKLTIKMLSLYVCAVYIPPDSSETVYELFFEFIESNCPVGSTILCLGDFNIPQILHSNFDLSHATKKCCNLYNFMSLFNLESFNNIRNVNGRTLDLVLTNIIDVTVVREEHPLVPEDKHHPALLCSFPHNQSKKEKLENNITGFNFRKANFEQMYTELSRLNWNKLSHLNDVNEALGQFYEMMYTTMSLCVPRKKCNSNKYPSWFTYNIIQKIKFKTYHHRKMKTGVDVAFHRDKFRILRRELKSEISLAYKFFIESSEYSINKDPRQFWNFVKSKTKHLSSTSLKYRDKELESNREVSRSFAHYFHLYLEL